MQFLVLHGCIALMVACELQYQQQRTMQCALR
jgi:hypothetical protein